MYRLLIIFSCLFLGFFLQTDAQSYLRAEGKAIVNEQGDTIILRGMGLGGWMLQEGYMLQTASFATAEYQIREKIDQLIGTANTNEFYDAWLANHCRKIDIDSLAAWGFNSVRLPMHYKLFTLPIEDEPVAGEHTWLTKGFELTDSLISWCRQNQMYVILDLHGAPGGQGYDQAISDYDPSKPSLWESAANQDKTVALWKRLAERYVNEPIVAGYDLLNEVNWNLPGGTLLRSLYEEITDSIRTVDDKHIIFIEGNWFANDFTGLTPPWDDNIVYSPHKYWSFNFKNDIQWVLTLRDDHNVPLYFGEAGENSNVWFRDAIKLMEDHGIGWAWWPLKKIESISCPLSVTKTAGYQALLDYWNNGGTPPSVASAKATLMQLTDLLKLENCSLQPDVADAMIRQVQTDETKPYHTQQIPGKVFATDFDMGRSGHAYFDTDLATYQVSTGSFTTWNTGWAYRNDAVDIEKSGDTEGNGFNVGWIADGEWMQYDVDIAQTAVYDIHVRVATDGGGGNFRFSMDGVDISKTRYVPTSGGWQSWQDHILTDVVLEAGTGKKLRYLADEGGYNLSSFDFVQKGATTTIDAEYLSAVTVDKNNVQLTLNKPIAGPLPSSPADISILVNGLPVTVDQVVINPINDRSILITVDYDFDPEESIKISYTGSQIDATDGTNLQTFIRKTVRNTIPKILDVPGLVECEDFFFKSGVDLENTFDTGGGKNIGNLDGGDYLDYYVNVSKSGTYEVAYRTAAPTETGEIRLQLIESDGRVRNLHQVSFDPTGDWQTWATKSRPAALPKGLQHLRVTITKPDFNMNWMDFTFLTDIEDEIISGDVQVYPNPSTGTFTLEADFAQPQQLIQLEVRNLLGQLVLEKELWGGDQLQEKIDLAAFPNGNYFLSLKMQAGVVTKKVVKIGL